MNSRKCVCLSVLTLLLCGPLVLADDQKGSDPQATQTINQLRDDYVKAFTSGDTEKLLTFYADDCVVMEPFEPAMIGKQNLRTTISEGVAKFDQSMTLKPEETLVFGDWAFDRGTSTITTRPKGGTGEARTINGKYLVLLKKQPNGDWKLARVIYNYNERPPASFFKAE